MISINTDIYYLQNVLNISNSRMRDYATCTVDEILESEAAEGNTDAINYARKLYNDTDEIIELFKLYNPENKYTLLNSMTSQEREKVLPLLEIDDMVIGMQFFNKEKILTMLEDIESEEMVNLVLNTFSLDEIMLMMPEEELQNFFANREVDKKDVGEYLKSLPAELMQQLMESLTGEPSFRVNSTDVINQITSLEDRDYQAIMASIDPFILRQIIYTMSEQEPDYLQLFDNKVYIEMINTLMKPDIIKPMDVLEKETLMDMMLQLNDNYLSIVMVQVDTELFAEYLMQDGQSILEDVVSKM